MRSPLVDVRLPPRLRALRLASLCFGLILNTAVAAPEGDDDPMGRYLQERGWVAAPAGVPAPTTWRDRAAEMVLTALNFLDLPYRRGGNSADDGFDCSGFTRHIFQLSLGQLLPRRVDEQAHAQGLVKVERDQLEPGDLVFFNTLRRTFSHVGIYVGEGKFIHSPRSGSNVRLEDMRQAYWNKRFTGARRSETAPSPAKRTPPDAVTPQAALLSR